MRDAHELQVWQAGFRLAVAVYKATKTWPKDELFGLTHQARRAASSVPANIAEGYGRFSDVELRRFCHIAHGSLCELDTHLRLARELAYLSKDEWDALHATLMDAKRLLVAFLHKLTKDTAR